jgi:serine/threonine protein kinase
MALVKITSFEKKIINSLNDIPNDIDNNKKLSILVLVLFEILYKNNPNIKNKICNYLINKNILDDTILGSEYSKFKFVLEKMIISTDQKLIKNSNENNVYRENYTEIDKIANSSFGSVHKVFHKFEESYYAMKKVFITEELLNINYNFFKEVQIFSKLYHPNIVRYYTSFILLDEISINEFNDDIEDGEIEEYINNTTSILFIQMELCQNTFRDYIDNNKNNDTELTILNYFLEILNGIQYLHSLNIIHRDIKPTNIYMLNNVIKIGDFGLSTTYINNEELLMSNDIGTNFYKAPEIDAGMYNEKIDIYSCGKILLELLITTETHFEKYKIVKSILYNIDNNISNDEHINIKYNNIIKKSLTENVVDRYNIAEFIYDIKTVIKNI